MIHSLRPRSSRFPFAALASFLLILPALVPSAALAISSTVVISEFRVRGPNGGSDEFVEIYNLSSSAVNIGGWKMKGSNNAGTTSTRATVAAGTTLSPGCHFLFTNSSTSGGPYSGSVPGDQTYGTGITDDGGIAITTATDIVVDQVGMSAGSAFKEGTALASLGSSNLNRGYERKPGGASGSSTDTDNNSTDFQLTTPSDPQSSSSPCIVVGNPSGSGSANPSAVAQGDTTLLTVAVTPGSNPTSTGLQVTGDLTAIGGSATQQFFDDGTNGDATPNDLTFSYAATVAASTAAGNKMLPISITDAQARTGSASIALSVVIPLAIHDIQGPGSASPYAGSPVQTTGIVTGLKSNGFFVQTRPGFEDGDPDTSEGVFVFTSSTPPAAAAVGNEVRVTGTVQEFIPSADPNSPPATEIAGSPSVSVISTGNPLPEPVTLTAADTSPSGSIEQLEKYEGMRVHVDSLTVVAPTQGSINEPGATSISNGVFYGVLTGIARPFREPGIQIPDPLPPGSPCCVPRFDANPERLRVDSDGQPGGAILEVTTGAIVTDLTGPLDYSFRTYTILPDPPPAPAPGVSGNLTGAIPVPVPDADQFTVASFNMERFFDTTDDPGISDVALTQTAFNNRLNKASLAIRNVLQMPDILGVEEMENLATLQALAAKVNNDAVAASQPSPGYTAYLEEGNDIGGIDVGFLVKSTRVHVIDVTQYNKDETYINPNNGQPELLNDRPSLILRATIQTPAGSPYPVTVIVNHLRSLSGVDDPVDGYRVRAKRRAQAESLANLVQARQTGDPNEHIVLVGDFNAYEFSDGYVDVVGAIKGTPAACDQVVLCSFDLVNPDLVDLAGTVPAADRYSYSFDGAAQVLDHELVTQNLMGRFDGLRYARNDADFPESFRNDPNRPERISDHDMAVAYFRLPLLSALSPANIWVGLKNSDDVGVRFDLRAEVYYNGSTLIGSGELASVAGGSSGFNNAKLDSIPLALPAAVGFLPGDSLSIRLLVRTACSGSGHSSGTARLWFNDAASDSHFDATVDDEEGEDYLLAGGVLGVSPGTGPKKTIDVPAGARCSAYKPFGTWARTIN